MPHHYTKHNHTPFSDALMQEAEGLDCLRQGLGDAGVRVPDVFGVDHSSLEMTAIDPGAWNDRAWERLAAGLARLHRVRQPHFGFHRDNYIGLNPQKNTPADNWGDFFIRYRLGFQIALVEDREIMEGFEAVIREHRSALSGFLNAHCEFPSLVHGDLWQGNVLCDRRGDVWLIDPAVYFGDREVDLAMTEMFGGFAASFYKAYDRLLPRSPVYPVKREIYNLYHYLNHYNLFGSGYLRGCRRGFDAVRGL